MNKLLISFAILTLASCSTTYKKDKIMEKESKPEHQKSLNNTAIPKITGIGGIFFYSDNPNKLNDWYTKNLGIEINQWGSSSFESRSVNRPDEINSLQWKPFKKEDEYFSPSKKGFMINYQVQNIEELVTKLKESGVAVLDSITSYDYGKFVHIIDDEGNKIELWEPN